MASFEIAQLKMPPRAFPREPVTLAIHGTGQGARTPDHDYPGQSANFRHRVPSLDYRKLQYQSPAPVLLPKA
jgi:hypothetical protein